MSLAACGSSGVPGPVPGDSVAVTGATRPIAPAASSAVVAVPRVTPDGRPACGNVALRAPSPPDCDVR
jgi:hypothetical protein